MLIFYSLQKDVVMSITYWDLCNPPVVRPISINKFLGKDTSQKRQIKLVQRNAKASSCLPLFEIVIKTLLHS